METKLNKGVNDISVHFKCGISSFKKGSFSSLCIILLISLGLSASTMASHAPLTNDAKEISFPFSSHLFETCDPGFFMDNNGDCVPCPAGTYNPTSGATECILCEAGRFQDEIGQTECKDCPIGTANNTLGAQECTACPSGFFSANAGAVSCTTCPSNRPFSNPGSSECVECITDGDCAIGASCINNTCTCNPATPVLIGPSAADPESQCVACTSNNLGSCGANEVCNNNECECLPGYIKNDNGDCIDINECNTGLDNCNLNASCTNIDGGFTCECNEGYEGDGVTCTDIDECENSPCPPNSQCNNTDGSFECLCDPGFVSDGNGGCEPCPAGTYNPTSGATVCMECEVGKFQDEIGQTECKDCPIGTANNTLGAELCSACPSGSFSANAGAETCESCILDNGCTDCSPNNGECIECTENAEPDPSNPAACQCSSGFYNVQSDGLTCIPCDESCADCDPTSGECISCPNGYALSDGDCVDINECADGSNNCHPNAYCTNIDGGFTCECNEGYEGDGVTCTDIDECENNPCPPNSQCNNSDGSFECLCDPGFVSDGNGGCEPCPAGTYNPTSGATECLSCEVGKFQDETGQISCKDCPVGTSNNTLGAELCTACPSGFFSANEGAVSCTTCPSNRPFSNPGSSECVECLTDGDCAIGASCINNTCTCNPETPVLIGPSTADPESQCVACTSNNLGSCGANAVCNNNECECLPGFFKNDNGDCIDIDECADNSNNCDPYAFCTNIDGGFTCECIEGYEGDGVTCTDIDECENNPCPPNSQCNNSDGSFECLCDPGFVSDGNGGCEPCPAGTYNPTSGATECIQCEVGKFQDEIGQTECKDCPIGTANNTLGAELCSACPSGSFSANEGTVSCPTCPEDTPFSNPGSSECVECLTDVDADDGIFCNGQETCVNGMIVMGTPPCDNGLLCDENTEQCVTCLTDSDADDGIFCNGQETCINGMIQAGTQPCASGELCDENVDACYTEVSFTCPDNITVNADPGVCCSLIDVPLPMVMNGTLSSTTSNNYNNAPNASGLYFTGMVDVEWTITATQDITGEIVTGNCTHTIEVIDNQPPVFGITTEACNILSASCSNDLADLAAFIEGKEAQLANCTTNQCTETLTLEIRRIQEEFGKTKFQCMADGGCSINFTSNGVLPPLEVIAPQGACEASVDPMVVIADNCSQFTVTNDFNSEPNAAGIYPEGETTVTWMATDQYGNKSTASRVIRVITDGCDQGCVYTDFYFEDFESGYGQWNDGGNDAYLNYEPGNGGNGSNYCIRLRDNSGSRSSIYTDHYDFTHVSEVMIDFMYSAESMEHGEDFILEYSTDGGHSYHEVRTWVSGVDFDNDIFYNESVMFTGPFSQETVIRIRVDASSNRDKVFFDNVLIKICEGDLPDPVDCVVSDWSEWSSCSETCGGGTQTRTRTVITDAANGGTDCPHLEETRACNEDPCDPGACIAMPVSHDDFEQGLGNWIDGGTDAFRKHNFIAGRRILQPGVRLVRLRDNSGSSSSIYTGSYDLSDHTSIDLVFQFMTISFDDTHLGTNKEDFFFEYSIDGGASWIVLESWVYRDDFENNVEYSVDRTYGGLTLGADVRFRFRCDATSNGDKLYLDDIIIQKGCESTNSIKGSITKSRNLALESRSENVISELSEISLSPNPTSGIVTLDFKETIGTLNVEVYDYNGVLRTEMIRSEHQSKLSLNLTSLEGGVYLIRVIDEKGHSIVKRVILSK